MPHTDWIEHRRASDRELLGWICPDGEHFVALDRLGRELTGPVDWLSAEEALDSHGLAWLADLWQYTPEGGARERVRIVEVAADRVVVRQDDFGAIEVTPRTYTLAFPAPSELQPFQGDAHRLEAMP